jgi:nucleotide-binding universal stress UspA family protein
MVDGVDSSNGLPSKIVVGTDGSVTAGRAVHRATALAAALGVELIIVTAYGDRAPGGVPAAGVSIDSGWVGAARGAAETTVAAAGEKARAAGVANVSCLVLGGEPSDVLVKVTADEGADLLVVGSKGMQSTARFLLGPIANKVSRRVSCDLLIVETSD